MCSDQNTLLLKFVYNCASNIVFIVGNHQSLPSSEATGLCAVRIPLHNVWQHGVKFRLQVQLPGRAAPPFRIMTQVLLWPWADSNQLTVFSNIYSSKAAHLIHVVQSTSNAESQLTYAASSIKVQLKAFLTCTSKAA